MCCCLHLRRKPENTAPGECSPLKITITDSKEHSDDVEEIKSSTRQQIKRLFCSRVRLSDCEYVLVRKNNDVLAVSAVEVEVQLQCALMRHDLHSVITDALNYFNILFPQNL